MSQKAVPSAGILAPLIERERLTSRLQELVQSASENPPGNEAACAALLARWCGESGLDVEKHAAEPHRPSIVARLPGGDGPTVAFCSHTDVVPAGDAALWSRDPFGATIEDGVLHGRGACDAKGAIAAALEAVEMLRDSGIPLVGSLELYLVCDEEAMGFKGAGFLVEQGIVAPDICIVGEPTNLAVVRAQRGAAWFRITTRGLAAHGSAPERGRNAIVHMAEIAARLEETLPDVNHELLGGASISVGTIRGGEKVNIVPASCVLEVDRRSVPQESKESIVASIEKAIELARDRHPDLDAEVELAFYGAPFETPEDSSLVSHLTAAAGEVTGAPPVIAGFRGASDARFLAAAGAEVVVLGPGDIRLAHTASECISLAEVEQAAALYAVAFARLLAPQGLVDR